VAGNNKKAEQSMKKTDQSLNKDVNENSLDSGFLRSFLYPRSVSVIGASKKAGSIGYNVMKCIMQSGFNGVVYPVNPTVEAVMSVKSYASVTDVPGTVDLAVIVVPARNVLNVLDECGKIGIKAVIVISDGFREAGEKGQALEKSLIEMASQYGIRLIGPNCIGIINPDPDVSLNASFCPVYPPDGGLAIVSQSGALGLTILEYAAKIDLGISCFISVGNSSDLKVADFLQYLEKDSRTKVIMLYLESFESPAKFAALARKISLTKPIIVIKSGRTHAGLKAASSHTGAMASQEIAVDALFRQSGVIRAQTFLELLGTSILLSSQPLPRGRRIAILTQAGGAATISADACEQYRLDLQEFSEKSKDKIHGVLTRSLNINNPFDLTGGVNSEEFCRVAEILAEDENTDILFLIWGPVVVIDREAIEDIINKVAVVCRNKKKTLVSCFMIPGFTERTDVGKSKQVPVFQVPEGAIAAISRACDYVDAVESIRHSSYPQFPDIRKNEARKLIEKAVAEQNGRPFWLSAESVSGLFDCYGIRQARTLIARTSLEAADIAARLGFPVAVKLYSSTLVHKTEVGGVLLDLKSAGEVKMAFDYIRQKLADTGRVQEMEGVTVQPMIKGGIEAIVGVTQDMLGPLIMFGLGGIYTELLKDTAFRLYPLTDHDANDMVHSIKTARIFDGFRDLKPSDTRSIEELLLRISALIGDIPEISELDLNPVKVMPQGEGYWVVDARILIKKRP